MKRYFFTTFFSLIALLTWAQGTATISGTVHNAAGAPVPHWLIYAIAGDSSQWGPVTTTPATAVTGLDGQYTVVVDLPPGVSTVTVLTDDGCLPMSSMLAEIVTLNNGAGTADFLVCADTPPTPDCSAYLWYEPTNDSLGLLFHADFWAIDDAPAASYLWDFGDGTTSTEASPEHVYAAGGEYVVTLTVTSATGCTATTESFVWVGSGWPGGDCWTWVLAQPADSLTFTFSAETFSGQSGNPVPAVSYLWEFGDGATSTEANPTHTYAGHGFYDVSVIVLTADSCTAYGYVPVWTDQPPLPDCRAFILQNQLDSTTFSFATEGWTISGAPINIVEHHWDFGDGNTSTEAEPTHTYAAPGIYTVSLTGLTEDSCEIYACDVVMACNCPIDSFWYGCQAMFGAGFAGGFDPAGNPLPGGGDPLTMTFWDMSIGAVTSWAWDFGDSTTSTEQNPVHTYAEEGVYTVTLSITTLDDCESSVSFEIYVGDDFPWLPEHDCQALFVPIPDSPGTGGGIQFIDLSWSAQPITAWLWEFGDGATSTEQHPYHVYAQPGVYTVNLTIAGDSCNSIISYDIDTDSPWQFANQPASIGQSSNASKTSEPAAFASLHLAPNPAVDAFTLAFTAAQGGDVEIRLTDLAGRALQTTRHAAQAGANTVRVPVQQLAPGVYVAQLVAPGGTRAVRFVKG